MIDDTDDTDDDTNDPVEHRRILSLAQLAPRLVFRDPFEQRFQQWENSSPSRSSEIGDTQGVLPSTFLIGTQDFF